MDDYTLYLVKKAYLKKLAGTNMPIAYDPVEVYDNALEEEIDKVDATSTKNRDRLRQEYADRYGRNARWGYLGAIPLAALGAGIGLQNGPIGSILGGLATGGVGALGAYMGTRAARKAGWEAGSRKGSKMDGDEYQKAKAKAIRDFHIKMTGTNRPSKFQKHKAGITIYDQL